MEKNPPAVEKPEPAGGPLLSDVDIPIPATLYHYCGKEAFDGILSNGCLWLSDAAYMNDKTEGIWMDRMIETMQKNNEMTKWTESGHVYHDYKIAKRTFSSTALPNTATFSANGGAMETMAKALVSAFPCRPGS
jgi:hypothetical protein